MGRNQEENSKEEMNYRLIIRKRAEKHFAEIYDWYEKQRKGLGDEFMLCAEAALLMI